MREEREGLVQSLQRRAKENPLQVAAWVPPPWRTGVEHPSRHSNLLLLIGAGLF